MEILGLDVGGATLKLANASGWAHSRPFQLWREPQNLSCALRAVPLPKNSDAIALTMTGELCDCFQTKADGIRSIIDSVRAAFASATLYIYRTDGQFVNPQEAIVDPWAVAASNWHALGTFAGRYAPAGEALLIDIGTTTTDLIPLRDGSPSATGRTDVDRLATGELVYSGVCRTPLCALASSVSLHGKKYRTMAELFATTADVWLTLEECPEDPNDIGTADGRPATRDAARDRLARMIGSDRTQFSKDDAVTLARQFAVAQEDEICAAAKQVLSGRSVQTLLLSGQGEFLARRLLHRLVGLVGARIVSLGEQLGVVVSRAACAHAAAVLLSEKSTP